MKNEYYTLLEISKEDLNASKLLFENEMYPQSLFYFQQSAEKLVKYIGLKEEVIEKSDLQKKVSHKSTLIFRRAIIKYQNQFPSHIDFDIDKELQGINNFINNNPTPEVVRVVLDQIKDAIENKPSLPFDIDSLEKIEDFCKILEQINPGDPNIETLRKIKNNDLFMPIMDQMIKEFKSKLPDYTQSIMILFIVNSLSEKLVSSVRYPDLDDMINPRLKYNLKNPMIEALPIFHNALLFCSEMIEKIETNN